MREIFRFSFEAAWMIAHLWSSKRYPLSHFEEVSLLVRTRWA